MALTPDDIAQKVFTPRFRGIDPVEVREFLLLAAAQITDLHDRIRQQKEQLDAQEKELSLAADDKKSFDDVLEVYKQKIDTLTTQLGETRQQQAKRDEELKRVKQLLEGVQRERQNLKGELDRAQSSLSEAEIFKQKIDSLTTQLDQTRQQQAERDEELKRVKQSLDGVQRERENLKGELDRAQSSLSEAEISKQKIDSLTTQLEQTRQQQAGRDEELKRVKQSLDGAQRERDNLKGELDRVQTSMSDADEYKQKIDTLTTQLEQTRQQQVNRDEELNQVKQSLDGVQRERDNLKGELGQAQTSLSEVESKSRMSRAAIEGLRNKIVVIEAEKAELIGAAEQHQRILDEARHQSDEQAEETKLQTERMVAEAREEIAGLRDSASQELVAIREDIDKLNAHRRKLYTDLRDLLHDHLDRLSEYTTGSGGPTKSEYDDLFQKIDFAELAELEEEATLDDLTGNEQTSGEQAGESEETLRTKLKDGGIAYLSDE